MPALPWDLAFFCPLKAPLGTCDGPDFVQDLARVSQYSWPAFGVGDSAIDLRSAPRGLSQLAIRRTGEGWQLFPASRQGATKESCNG